MYLPQAPLLVSALQERSRLAVHQPGSQQLAAAVTAGHQLQVPRGPQLPPQEQREFPVGACHLLRHHKPAAAGAVFLLLSVMLVHTVLMVLLQAPHSAPPNASAIPSSRSCCNKAMSSGTALPVMLMSLTQRHLSQCLLGQILLAQVGVTVMTLPSFTTVAAAAAAQECKAAPALQCGMTTALSSSSSSSRSPGRQDGLSRCSCGNPTFNSSSGLSTIRVLEAGLWQPAPLTCRCRMLLLHLLLRITGAVLGALVGMLLVVMTTACW